MALCFGVRLEPCDGVESLGTREAKMSDGHDEGVVGVKEGALQEASSLIYLRDVSGELPIPTMIVDDRRNEP